MNMACFVHLHSARTGAPLALNLDLAICVIANQGHGTDILFVDEVLYTVRETPQQILACVPAARV